MAIRKMAIRRASKAVQRGLAYAVGYQNLQADRERLFSS